MPCACAGRAVRRMSVPGRVSWAYALFLGWLAAASAANGYFYQQSGNAQLSSTRAALLNTTNVEIVRLTNGFTLMLWIRFDDTSPSIFQANVQILTLVQGNFMQPFGGYNEGFQFGGALGLLLPLFAGTLGMPC